MEMDSQFLVLPLFLGGIASKETNTLMIVQTIDYSSRISSGSVQCEIQYFAHVKFILFYFLAYAECPN